MENLAPRVLNIVSEFGPVHALDVVAMLRADGVANIDAEKAVTVAAKSLSVYTIDAEGYMEVIAH